MSDNLPPEVVQEELEARLRIPTEVWTDVFKLLPRRVLVQQVAPVCYYFKEISDKNVKNVHVIKNADQFTEKLNNEDPEANQQLEQLAGNKCQLAGQFRLNVLVITEKSQDVLRHSLDLLQGCQLSFCTYEQLANDKIDLLDECLSILESTKPITIEIDQEGVLEPDGTFWLNPTVQKCGRIVFNILDELELSNYPLRTYVAISHWLHHRPMDCNCSGADQQVRCMIFWSADPNHFNWLLDRCSKNIQQGRELSDRRQYVLSFECWNAEWTGFDQFRRIENKSTGEVLTLERKMLANGEATNCYRLRRCLTEEEANGAMFYAEMFKQDYGIDMFNIGDETPDVVII